MIRGFLMCIAIVFLLLMSPVAYGASVYFDTQTAAVGVGESLSVAVRLDTTLEECVNALDGIIEFDEGLQVVDTSVGSSIFSFWVEPPLYDNEKRTVTFAGGIPNGYCGRVAGDPTLTNNVVEIIFRATGSAIGDRKVYFSEQTTAYLNDGFGTAVPVTSNELTIDVRDEYTAGDDVWLNRVLEDDIPPKDFSITLAQNDTTFKGDYFIVFNTNDKQTGIDHYQVMEEPLNDLSVFGWGAATAPWVDAVSPYRLTDQSLNSIIRVKAIDKAGNEYIATLVPEEDLRSIDMNSAVLFGLLLLALTLLVIVIIILISSFLYRSRRTSPAVIENDIHENIQ